MTLHDRSDFTVKSLHGVRPETRKQVRDALSFFQAMDADRNGVVSRDEFAERMHLSTHDAKVRWIYMYIICVCILCVYIYIYIYIYIFRLRTAAASSRAKSSPSGCISRYTTPLCDGL